MINTIEIEFDPDKNATNIQKHGFSLDAFELLDLDCALYIEDKRQQYGEPRFLLFAPLDGRLCTAVYTPRGNRFRIISLRKSNSRERKWYDQTQK